MAAVAAAVVVLAVAFVLGALPTPSITGELLTRAAAAALAALDHTRSPDPWPKP